MQGPLDIEADLTLKAPDGSVRIHAQGRGIQVEATSLRVFKHLPAHSGTLANLRQLAATLAMADQALALRAKGLAVIDLDPALSGRWLGRLLRVPGLRLHFFNWLRARN